ncbi:hypothetical protein [Paenibacillus glucanolyticus]|uniref:hypothetical protein n=1 Tax=Paenibacillus glucanolyticus TaxID=59843 RepID=UPI0015C4055F|nr:hypothetical protein [Paenibacillus glucanolyticus]
MALGSRLEPSDPLPLFALSIFSDPTLALLTPDNPPLLEGVDSVLPPVEPLFADFDERSDLPTFSLAAFAEPNGLFDAFLAATSDFELPDLTLSEVFLPRADEPLRTPLASFDLVSLPVFGISTALLSLSLVFEIETDRPPDGDPLSLPPPGGFFLPVPPFIPMLLLLSLTPLHYVVIIRACRALKPFFAQQAL